MRKQAAVKLTPYNPLKADLTTQVWSSASPYNHDRPSRGPNVGAPISEDARDTEAADIPARDLKNCVRVGTKVDRFESYQATSEHDK
jgi:hypothetical protein